MSLKDDIIALNAEVMFAVKFSRTPRGRIRWEATMSGDDFLNGYWENTKTSTAKDHKSALQAAVDAFNRGKS